MKRLKIPTIITSILILAIFGILLFFYIKNSKPEKKSKLISIDLHEIIHRDTIFAVTSTNNIDYFIYRGTPMGFQFELLEVFSKHIGVKLILIVENDSEKIADLLLNNECDIIAISMPHSREKELLYNFTEPITEASLVLIQRISENSEDAIIRNQNELEGKVIHIEKDGFGFRNLRNISEEIGKEIIIVEIDSIDKEQIIRYVSEGIFDFTVADENLARFNQQIFKNLDVSIPISFPQKFSWGVRKESTLLLDTLNKWINHFTKTREYQNISNKYFLKIGRPSHNQSIFYSGNSGIISNYDAYIKKYCKIINWDWRLLASLIYQESRFDHDVVSWAGAFGIMQLMPSTAEHYGIDSSSSVEDHIIAGVKYLKYLDTQFSDEITDSIVRIKLILSSYNIGFGHVLDALRLTEHFEKSVNSWKHIRYYLINLTNPKYYRHEVVRNGYFPGIHAVVFSESIYERFLHYRNIIPDEYD